MKSICSVSFNNMVKKLSLSVVAHIMLLDLQLLKNALAVLNPGFFWAGWWFA